MDFVCGAFVCAVVCASPAPRRRATRTSPLQGTCHHPTTTSAAGEPARRRRRAPQEPPLLRAPKSLRAPPSWAHFSVAFSQTVDLTFPIFTKPTTVDKKWQKPTCRFMDRSSGRCGRCGGRARPVLGAVAGAGGLSDGSPVRIRPPVCCAARRRCSQRRCARCSSWLDRRLPPSRLPGRGHCSAPTPPS